MKSVIIALLAVMLIANALGAEFCAGKRDGKYPAPATGCKKWYDCKNKKGPLLTCSSGQKFNDSADKCQPQNKVSCRV